MKGAGKGKEGARALAPLSPRPKGFSWVLKPGGYFKSSLHVETSSLVHVHTAGSFDFPH